MEEKYDEAYERMNGRLRELASVLGKTYHGDLPSLRKEFEARLLPEVLSLINPESHDAIKRRATKRAAALYPELIRQDADDALEADIEDKDFVDRWVKEGWTLIGIAQNTQEISVKDSPEKEVKVVDHHNRHFIFERRKVL